MVMNKKTSRSKTTKTTKTSKTESVKKHHEAKFNVFDIKLAAYSGIVLMLLFIPILALSYYRENYSMNQWFVLLYSIVTFLTIFGSIFYFRGFIKVAQRFNNYLLEIISYIMIFATILLGLYDMLTLINPTLQTEAFGTVQLIFTGLLSIAYGISLISLNKEFGGIATAAAVLNIIIGICTASTLLAFVTLALLLYIPSAITEVVLLFKASSR